jgi:8-oxo-dGTP pyrophosphatase MutT (NUDIX family)
VPPSLPAIRDALRLRLAQPLPGLEAQLRMAPRPRPGWDPFARPAGLRDAAGLVLLYPHDGAWLVPLTLRGAGLRHHTGQVSLPGGRVDPGESIEAAALREADEEVGLRSDHVEILGQLTPLHVPVSSHLLHPVVGLAAARPAFTVAEVEVERLIEAPLERLRDPAAVSWERRRRELPPAVLMDVPYFEVDGARVWGATAMILAEFLAVIAEVEAGGARFD